MTLNLLSTTAVDLRRLLESGTTTSVQLVLEYLTQIQRLEPKLHAFISVAPRQLLLHEAAARDEERRQGRVGGPLHGIPIVLKDCFITAAELGMGTTAGSWALVGAAATANSALAQRLLNQGLIILGKTNMTEFAGLKSSTMTPGWSAVGGQTLSPYVGAIADDETILGHSSPGGSSTGSAVAVAAGFSPLAVGAETIGSIITPANRAGLYALKPTVGVQDTRGTFTLTDSFDSPGPMAKSAMDVLLLTEILFGKSFSREKLGAWDALSVGFLDLDVWKMGEETCRQHLGTAEQMKADYKDAVAKLSAVHGAVKYPAVLADVAELMVDGQDAIMPIAFWEFKNVCIPKFLEGFDACAVRNLEDIVKFNQDNGEKYFPSPYTEQDDLIKALHNIDEGPYIAQLKTRLRATAHRILDDAFDSQGLNIIAAPADSPLCVHAAAAGYPIATVPLGQLRYNNRPFGLCMVAKANKEEVLLRFMAAWEASAIFKRPVPNL
ncbi:amidase signature domain-containing protein [Staphylotrichum tortipilum]|uniref:Amidase signature domain-containing protein n=1 Tax=Staphylotrichum tortipilum TaxID=2831512 RepID=A0AAN6RSD0_9PEZI|nr:amidase signature domain-containing protein [Staphylotrichum longicolle]